MNYGDIFFYTKSYKNQKIKLRYRIDPIPYTGSYGPNIRGYFRHVKTIQEKRWNLAYKNFVRNKRNSHNIPDSWDDLINSKEKIRNWKRTKKQKQWMTKNYN